MSWHTNRYVRLAGATVTVAVILSAVTPPATASAAAVNDRRNPAPSPNNPPPRRDVPDARQKTTPGSAAPSNPDPAHSQQETAPPPAPVTQPKPVQRKDKPPDRSAHKYTPKQRKPAARQQRRNKNNNRRQESRKRPDAPATAPGTAPTPQEAFQRGILDPINNFLRQLAGQPRLPKEADKETGKAAPRPKKRQAREDQRAEPGCGRDGCLTIEPTPEKPKPKPKWKTRALDNRKVVDKAEEELRKWQGIDAEGKTKYGIWYGGQGDALADWCARFVSYVFAEAGYPLPDMQKDVWDNKDTGFQLVAAGEAWAREHGWFHEGTAGIQPGDIVIYNWPHTGIATTGVNPDGTVDVIEGNTAVGASPGNEMAKQRRVGDINGQPGTGQIKGFIRPPTNTTLPGHLRARPGARPFRS